MPEVKIEGAGAPKACLNEWLRPKAEGDTGRAGADDNHEPVTQSKGELHNPAGEPNELNSSADTTANSATVPPAEPANPQWKLRSGSSTIAFSLSSPRSPKAKRQRTSANQPPGEDGDNPVLSADAAPGCTGGTGVVDEGRTRISDAKRRHNKWAKRRKLLEKNDPELLAHIQQLEKEHGRTSPEMQAIKIAISECEHGDFNTPYLNKFKKKCKLKEWGKTRRLGSWKEVCDLHGENVALAALKQGTLPYCPHPLLKPNHGVKWPDSHQFVLTETAWRDSWNTEDGVEADAEYTQNEIDELFAAHEPPPELPAWDAFRANASTGIPQG